MPAALAIHLASGIILFPIGYLMFRAATGITSPAVGGLFWGIVLWFIAQVILTEGSAAFLWEGGKHRYLFTGDTIYLKDGIWTVAVLAVSDRGAYAKSLELIRELEFDILVPSMARRPAVQTVTPAQGRARIDEILDRLQAGANA